MVITSTKLEFSQCSRGAEACLIASLRASDAVALLYIETKIVK